MAKLPDELGSEEPIKLAQPVGAEAGQVCDPMLLEGPHSRYMVRRNLVMLDLELKRER